MDNDPVRRGAQGVNLHEKLNMSHENKSPEQKSAAHLRAEKVNQYVQEFEIFDSLQSMMVKELHLN